MSSVIHIKKYTYVRLSRGAVQQGRVRAGHAPPLREDPARQLVLAKRGIWLNKITRGHNLGEPISDCERAPVSFIGPSPARVH